MFVLTTFMTFAAANASPVVMLASPFVDVAIFEPVLAKTAMLFSRNALL